MQFSAGEEKAPHGAEIFGHPLINKDAGFTAKERDEFGLRGLLPWRVATLAEQVAQLGWNWSTCAARSATWRSTSG